MPARQQEKALADFVLARFKEFGLDATMTRYDVFLNHPKSVSLKLTAPVELELSLREDPYDVDKDSTTSGMFPAFHGYGASGKAAGQVVYVNYGSPADFERLRGMGISVEGKVTLVRYGGAFRGLKVKESQDRGAVGVLIFSDPADDGYMRGDVYPDGPMRPPSAIQRGSVQFLSIQPGDPSTPGGAPSIAGAKRITREQMANVPKIPSLPISYREAEKILRRLGGPRVPDDWQGGLPFPYHIGPGAATVAMDVQMDEGLKPIYNVVATIKGNVEPEKLIVLGNHRDAWTHGAVDPNSGTAAMLEMARGFGAAIKSGWTPKRTIQIASWDAEEYGLVGSTEWAEEHAANLQKNAVAYINCDVAVTGPNLGLGGVPSLAALALEAAADVPDPRRGGSVGAALETSRTFRMGATDAGRTRRPRPRVPHAAQPGRIRLRLHRVPRSSRRSDHRLRVWRVVRRLSLGLRQLPLDGGVRRSGLPLPRRRGQAVGADGHAARERRRRAAAVRQLCDRSARGSERAAARRRPSRAHVGRSGERPEGADQAGLRADPRGDRRSREGGRGRGSRGRCGGRERRCRHDPTRSTTRSPRSSGRSSTRRDCRDGRGFATC